MCDVTIAIPRIVFIKNCQNFRKTYHTNHTNMNNFQDWQFSRVAQPWANDLYTTYHRLQTWQFTLWQNVVFGKYDPCKYKKTHTMWHLKFDPHIVTHFIWPTLCDPLNVTNTMWPTQLGMRPLNVYCPISLKSKFESK